MFPLIAITAFFILGIAFFAIGKDDFGIKRVKEGSNDTSTKEKAVKNPVQVSNIESSKLEETSSSESVSSDDSTTNISE
tara:strand:+ start:449 stop:685 length:237 start_codon:yes stop_codon:yes gene_type:complete